MDTKDILTNTFDIVGGPNKDALFDACKYADDKRASINILFSVRIGYTGLPDANGTAYILMKMSDVVIKGILHDDEVGEIFRLNGTCRIATAECSSGDMFWFSARYEPKIRKGEIRFSER